MGAVYEVEHTQLGVHYALKTFTLEGGHVDLLKNKFLTEGKVLARLHDPHLVRVFDLNFDEATGMPYFVMDLVLSEDGSPRTLLDVKTEELDEDCVLEWFADLASAIDYIHAQGIVHRDIKLGNVLLSSDGHVVLSDFGISRIFSERLRSDVNAVNTMVSEAVTGARLVMGTQGYMAPEVAWGGEATPASDSYSLSVKPSERPTTLSELVETLKSAPVIEQEKEEEPEAPPRRKRRVLFALAGAAAVAVAVIGYLVFYHRPAPVAVDDFDAAFGANGIYEGARR